MIEVVPVRVRCSEDGKRWYLSALTYSAMGRSGTPSEALTRLKQELAEKYPAITADLRIRSVSVTFPSSLSEDDFLDIDWLKKAEPVG